MTVETDAKLTGRTRGVAETYRKDIDGLRAIAILGVVLYHAGLSWIGGGYAGVDVFFVISGYLIGGHILDDLGAGRFSFRRFYARRFRRIFPALITVVAATLVVGWFTMMPHDYRYTGGAALTALLSLSNVWFYNVIDYFNPNAALDPLIHTWSLGIEEQFYLVIPLLMVLLWRRGRRAMGGVILAILAASFLTAVLTSQTYRMEAFYLIHTRAWELMAGVFVALAVRRSAPLPGRYRSLAYAAGLGLVSFGLVAVPKQAAWPGLWTVPAVLGTSAVLWAGVAPTRLAALLSFPAIRFIGLISYSLYLWHQPAFSFLGMYQLSPQGPLAVAAVLAALLGLSWLSWRFVEQPFRRPGALSRRGRLALSGAALAVVAAAIGGHVSKGFPGRLPPEALAIMDESGLFSGSYRRCLKVRSEVRGLDLADSCELGAPVPPTVAIWGDSHAGLLAEPLGQALKERGLALKQLTLSSCLPVPGLINVGQNRAEECPAYNAAVLAYLRAHPEIGHVVLFATWDSYFLDRPIRDMTGVLGSDSLHAEPVGWDGQGGQQARRSGIVDALATLLSGLGPDRRITLVLSAPRPEVDIPALFAKRIWWGGDLPPRAGYPRQIFEEQVADGRDIVSEAIARSGLPAGTVTVVDPAGRMCSQTQCDVVRDGRVLFADSNNHLSLAGVDLILPGILQTIAADE